MGHPGVSEGLLANEAADPPPCQAGGAGFRELMDEDSEEEAYTPKSVHGVKTGMSSDGGRATTLYLVEWENFPSPTDFTWEPRANFGQHFRLADAFAAQWKEDNKPWPPPKESEE